MTEHRLIENLDFDIDDFNEVCMKACGATEKATEQELKAFVENCQTMDDFDWETIFKAIGNQFIRCKEDGMLTPEEEDPHYSDKVCQERKKRGACESEDCWCILWKKENGEAPVLYKEDEPEDVSCVGCGERVCGYEEEPPHKDSRDEAVCDDCYTPPEKKVWKFKVKKSPEKKCNECGSNVAGDPDENYTTNNDGDDVWLCDICYCGE